jgi:hypothetical protein
MRANLVATKVDKLNKEISLLREQLRLYDGEGTHVGNVERREGKVVAVFLLHSGLMTQATLARWASQLRIAEQQGLV